MATWVVYHLIHVRMPHQHIPKLIITDVPEDVRVTRDLVERAGFAFGEFGIPWANHALEQVGPDSPADLVGAIRRGEGERIRYSDLVEMANAPL